MKKLMLCVVVLLGLGAVVSAATPYYYNGWSYDFSDGGNMNAADFEPYCNLIASLGGNWMQWKVPNSALVVVKHVLADYSLAVGDVFAFEMKDSARSNLKTIVVRITSRNGAFDYRSFQAL
ncbi:MAG: hypothetical protein Ta2A_19160 [Treponemataceae bacterium]|nr:MAG: hypothetical protein Ta2A_19160 [Treponemataceae bacterium]